MKKFLKIISDSHTVFCKGSIFHLKYRSYIATGDQIPRIFLLLQNANDGLMKIRIACTFNQQKKLTLKKKDAMHTSDGEIINIGADFIGQIFAIIIGKYGFQTVAYKIVANHIAAFQ